MRKAPPSLPYLKKQPHGNNNEYKGRKTTENDKVESTKKDHKVHTSTAVGTKQEEETILQTHFPRTQASHSLAVTLAAEALRAM